MNHTADPSSSPGASGGAAAHLRELAVGLLVSVFLLTAWGLFHGRDLNWDFLNYHVYAGFSASGDRLTQDYFPANVQSYLLGYGHVPLWLMLNADWSATAVATGLALQNLPTIAALWWLCLQLMPGRGARSVTWRWVAVVAGASSPLFLMEIGTSFIDAMTAAPIVAALAMIVQARHSSRAWWLLVGAGLCAGLATTLKLSNAPLALALLLPAALSGVISWRHVLLRLVVFGASAGISFALLYGPWGYALWQRFGNPFFPVLFNQWFKPPEFDVHAISLDRFRPISWLEFALRPLYLADPVANLYTEARAPDARFILLIALGIFAIWARFKRGLRMVDSASALSLTWLAAAWVLWLLSSGNGRYAIALALVGGAVLVAITAKAMRLRPLRKWMVLAACLAVIVQALLFQNTVFRWDGRVWAQHYLKPRLPASLVAKPHVIINLNAQSVSWLAPFAHPQSRFISPAGQYTIKPDTPAGSQLKSIFTSGLPLVMVYSMTLPDSKTNADLLASLEARSAPVDDLYGLVVDKSACQITPWDVPYFFGDRLLREMLMFCPVRYEPERSHQAVRDFARHDRIFDLIEKKCEDLFRPAGVQTLCTKNLCGRNYLNSDTTLMIYNDGGIAFMHFGGVQPGLIGTVDELRAGRAPVCPHKPGRYKPFSSGDTVMDRPQLR